MRRTILLALLAGLLASAPAGAAQERTYTGTIDGAEYRVVVPEPWNGTLLLYSHPYYPPNAGIPPGIGLASWSSIENWLSADADGG